ncbi:MAG TPA: amidohydrolase [Sporosarcina sp.]|nr:amidohydrolase [Sporosarcina sp.]
MEQLYRYLQEGYEEMVDLRRHLHQHPELSFEEVETPKLIAKFHEKLGHDVRTNVGGNGVVATLKGAKPGPTVALRADFDALPIQEENEHPFKSTVDGVMHACGHDGHTASLLGLAKAFNRLQDELAGNIVFIHQHAEELPPGGAIAMIEDGCLEGVDVIFGTHLWATHPLGEIGYRAGAFMAAPDRFDIKVLGHGGHGAEPELTKDSIAIAGQLIVNLQQVVSRRVRPLDAAVVSICSIEAKNPYNIIADSVSLTGTVRSFDEGVRTHIEEEIGRIVKGTCLAADANYDYQFTRGYPATVNHEAETAFLANIAQLAPSVHAVKEYEPQMGGEDFAYYLQHVKGTFFFTGAAIEQRESYPHHHPKFDFDERALLTAAEVLGTATLQYMKENPMNKGE